MTVWKETERRVSPAFEEPMSSAVMTPMAIDSRMSLLAGGGVEARHSRPAFKASAMRYVPVLVQ